MCDPITIAATALAAGSKIYSGVVQSEQLGYQAKVADANRAQASAAAQDALDRGKIAARNEQWKTAQTAGAQRAAGAANGIDLGFGSAVALAGDTAMISQINVDTLRANSSREARGYDINAANFGAQAAADRFNQDTIPMTVGLGVASSILGGATQYQNKQALAKGGSKAGAGTIG